MLGQYKDYIGLNEKVEVEEWKELEILEEKQKLKDIEKAKKKQVEVVARETRVAVEVDYAGVAELFGE